MNSRIKTIPEESQPSMPSHHDINSANVSQVSSNKPKSSELPLQSGKPSNSPESMKDKTSSSHEQFDI